MVRQPWATDRFTFPYLRVPSHHTPPLREEDDIVYSLWMVSQYMGNEFSNEAVRYHTKIPSIDEILGFIETDELGWTPNQSDLTALSAEITNAFVFSLDSWGRKPPRKLVDIAEDNWALDLPTIAYIDDLQMRRQIRGDGPMHTVVIVGGDETTTAIADPWVGDIREVNREKLNDSWDPSHHQIVEVELAPNYKTAKKDDE